MDGFAAWAQELTVYDALGAVGVVMSVVAYLFLQIGMIKGDGYLFPFANLVASLCILGSLSQDFNMFSASMEITWVAISMVGMVRIFMIERLLTLTPEEAHVISTLAPSLPKDRGRKILQMGSFSEPPPGTKITTEGEPVVDLAMILRGRCDVYKGGARIATLGPGALVGEMTYHTGANATADVIVENRARLFLLPAAALRSLIAKSPDIAAAMESAASGDIRRKLAETSRKLAEGPSAAE